MDTPFFPAALAPPTPLHNELVDGILGELPDEAMR